MSRRTKDPEPRTCACCLRPAVSLGAVLELEQFRGLCFECFADELEFIEAPAIDTPDWAKHLPPGNHAARLVRVQGDTNG